MKKILFMNVVNVWQVEDIKILFLSGVFWARGMVFTKNPNSKRKV